MGSLTNLASRKLHVIGTHSSKFTPKQQMTIVRKPGERLGILLASVKHCTSEASVYSNCVMNHGNVMKGSCQQEFSLLSKCMMKAAGEKKR